MNPAQKPAAPSLPRSLPYALRRTPLLHLPLTSPLPVADKLPFSRSSPSDDNPARVTSDPLAELHLAARRLEPQQPPPLSSRHHLLELRHHLLELRHHLRLLPIELPATLPSPVTDSPKQPPAAPPRPQPRPRPPLPPRSSAEHPQTCREPPAPAPPHLRLLPLVLSLLRPCSSSTRCQPKLRRAMNLSTTSREPTLPPAPPLQPRRRCVSPTSPEHLLSHNLAVELLHSAPTLP